MISSNMAASFVRTLYISYEGNAITLATYRSSRRKDDTLEFIDFSLAS